MKKIIGLLSIFLMLTASGDQFAVVQGEYVDLMNQHGENKFRLYRGAVVKVKNHTVDRTFYSVSLGKKVYAAPKSSFREVSSIFTEEKRLLGQIDKSHEMIAGLEKQSGDKVSINDQINKKISELQIWIEVQRDLSYSRDFFINKTKGSFLELRKLKIQSKENSQELRKINDQIKEEKLKLKVYEESFETLQTKLQPLKNQRSFYQRNYVEVRVVVKDTPVFLNGKIVDYLYSNTRVKVRKPVNMNGWYVFFKNKKAHYISSKDVTILNS